MATVSHRSATALAAALVSVACAGAFAAPVYITVGDDAHRLLQRVAPEALTLSSRAVPVLVPERRGGSPALRRASETVHAVEVDDTLLPALSQAVHEELRRCGGYVQHDSMAEALATLHRLQQPAEPLLAPSYTIDDAALVNPLLAQMQASNILATIQSLSDFQNRISTSSSGVAASDWLYTAWKALAAGHSGVRVTKVRHVGFPQKSVSFVIAGSDHAAESIVLGAHLDSIAAGPAETARAPGADDDASGIASLTEVIRVLMNANYKPRRTIEFIGYAAEEAGLRGSQQIAAKYQRQGQQVVGVLQLDMTAYQGDPTDLWIYTDYTNTAQNQFVAALAAAYLPQLTVGYDKCGYGCSDHASWTGKGYAASFPFEASFAHDNKAIHTPNDTIATFGGQASHALKFSQLALAFAIELGSD